MAFIKLIEGTWLASNKIIAVFPVENCGELLKAEIELEGGIKIGTSEDIDNFMDRLANTLNLMGMEV